MIKDYYKIFCIIYCIFLPSKIALSSDQNAESGFMRRQATNFTNKVSQLVGSFFRSDTFGQNVTTTAQNVFENIDHNRLAEQAAKQTREAAEKFKTVYTGLPPEKRKHPDFFSDPKSYGEWIGQKINVATIAGIGTIDEDTIAENSANKTAHIFRKASENLHHKLRSNEFANTRDNLQSDANDLALAAGKAAVHGIQPIAQTIVSYTLVTVGSIFVMYLAQHYIHKYIDERLLETDFITEQSDHSFFGAIRRFLGYDQYIGPKLSELVLTQESQIDLNQYLSTLKQAETVDIELPSLILHGPSGTGKTEVARRIIKELGCNYVIFSGASLYQFKEKEVLSKISNLFKWAQTKSQQKTIILINEADILLGQEQKSIDSKRNSHIISHLLSLTNHLSKDYTIIYTVQNIDHLDESIRHQTTHHIEMTLPNATERACIAQYYFDQNISKYELVVDFDLDNLFYQNLAYTLKGFSGRHIHEIAKIATNMATLEEKTLTYKTIMYATKQVQKKLRTIS